MQTPVVYQPQLNRSRPIQHYSTKISRSLALIQIIAGVLSISLNIALIMIDSALSQVGYGIWGGTFFIVAGSIGLGAAHKKTKCLISTYMVLSVLAVTLCVGPMIGLSVSGIKQDIKHHKYPYYGFDQSHLDASNAIHGILIFLALMEALVGIFAASQGCATVCCECCRQQPEDTEQLVVQNSLPGFTQPVFVTNHPGNKGTALNSGFTAFGMPGTNNIDVRQ